MSFWFVECNYICKVCKQTYLAKPVNPACPYCRGVKID